MPHRVGDVEAQVLFVNAGDVVDVARYPARRAIDDRESETVDLRKLTQMVPLPVTLKVLLNGFAFFLLRRPLWLDDVVAAVL